MNNLKLLTKAQEILTASLEKEEQKTAWETGFLSLGLAHFDWTKAANSIRDFFENQQDNGFLPYSPTVIATENIVHPPIWGAVIWKLYQQAEEETAAVSFLQEMFPKIVRFHQYLYENRDPEEEGLCYIHHPLEDILTENPHWKNALPPKDSDSYFYIQDPFFNTILTWSNEALIRVAEVLKADVTELVQWYELTVHTFNEKLWDEEYGIYNAWDLVADKVIPIEGIAGLLPLIGGLPDIGQALQMLDLLYSDAFAGQMENPMFLCPSHSLESTGADATKKAHGAISLDLNWLLYHGLKQYETPEFLEVAEQVKKDSLTLLSKNGFYEYFDARQEKVKTGGLGGDVATNSAAVLLDWLL